MGAEDVEDERSDRDDRLNPIKQREAVKGWCNRELRWCWDFMSQLLIVHSYPRSGEDALPLLQAYVSLATADVAQEQ